MDLGRLEASYVILESDWIFSAGKGPIERNVLERIEVFTFCAAVSEPAMKITSKVGNIFGNISNDTEQHLLVLPDTTK